MTPMIQTGYLSWIPPHTLTLVVVAYVAITLIECIIVMVMYMLISTSSRPTSM